MGILNNPELLRTYATIAAKFGSGNVYVDDAIAEKFESKPADCFLCLVLNLRYTVADELLKKFPDFAETRKLMDQNRGENLTRAGLESEFGALCNHNRDPKYTDDYIYVSLLASLAYALYYTSDDPGTLDTLQVILGKLDKQENIMGYSNVLAAAALWFADRNGFRDLVNDAYSKVLIEREEERRYAEQAAREEQEREASQRAYWRTHNLCQNCGGSFSGLFTKKCSKCGKLKDY
ncbi:hypothetical protein JNO48_04485 [Clostridiales bacterium]|nr:hypothetical protein JNO48_04485 [Clostridiales bacterium]